MMLKGRKQPAVHLPLIWTLRVLGGVDMLAFVAVVMPREWIGWGHELVGLGEFPDAAIARYLARSASALYALHGMMVIYMSFDVERYWPLIRFLAYLAIVHGIVMFAIDTAAGMPLWWVLVEGPVFTLTGLLVLALRRETAECSAVTSDESASRVEA